MNTRVLRLLAFSLAAFFATDALAQEGGGPPPANVRLDAAQEQQVTTMRTVNGDLRATMRSMVAAEDEGRVVSMLVETGDFVEKGQVLATLDTALIELDIARLDAEASAMRASLVERKAQQRQAERDLARRKEAMIGGSVAESEIEDAEIAVDAARARVQAAEASLASAIAEADFAREVMDHKTIRAPFAGQVVSKLTEVGAWVGMGGTVVELVALDTIDAYISVPERHLAQLLKDDAKIDVQIAAIDDLLTSTDVTVIAAGNELARTFPVRVRFKNPGRVLKPGMSVKALVPIGTFENAITIHKDAVLRDEGGAFAYFDAGGMAMPTRFTTRWQVGDRVVVTGGRIEAGMRFVIEGNERLFPTQPIADMNADPPATSDTEAPATPSSN